MTGALFESLLTVSAPVLESVLAAIDPEPAHVVGVGGALGAICRHGISLFATRERFPLATLTVNVIGSFVFALAVFGGSSDSLVQFVGIGFCGSFTTFSTFSVETVQLWERGDRRVAILNAVSNLLVSLGAIGLAWVLVATV